MADKKLTAADVTKEDRERAAGYIDAIKSVGLYWCSNPRGIECAKCAAIVAPLAESFASHRLAAEQRLEQQLALAQMEIERLKLGAQPHIKPLAYIPRHPADVAFDPPSLPVAAEALAHDLYADARAALLDGEAAFARLRAALLALKGGSDDKG